MSLYRAAAVKVRVGADRSVSEWVDDRARRPSCSSSRRMHAAQDLSWRGTEQPFGGAVARFSRDFTAEPDQPASQGHRC
jgi:hypothetical protein